MCPVAAAVGLVCSALVLSQMRTHPALSSLGQWIGSKADPIRLPWIESVLCITLSGPSVS